MMLWLNFFFIIIAYLFGSLSSAIIVCKVMNLPDPRTLGSQNPGATNVLRIGGKFAAAITLLGDLLKSVIPICIAKWFGVDTLTISLVALAAFIGHLFPIFFKFAGGKGVATFLGCLLALAFPTGLIFIANWLIVAFLFRYSSLASLIASIFAPISMWIFSQDINYTLVTCCMVLFLFYRHRKNILHLIAGTESKIKQRKNTSGF